eukprot:scaffold435_cov275-Chaetoceros_neogracile.AAC.84
MGMLLLSSNKRRRNDTLWIGAGASLVLLMTIIEISLIGATNVPEGLGNACTFYEDFHVEDYDCTCN